MVKPTDESPKVKVYKNMTINPYQLKEGEQTRVFTELLKNAKGTLYSTKAESYDVSFEQFTKNDADGSITKSPKRVDLLSERDKATGERKILKGIDSPIKMEVPIDHPINLNEDYQYKSDGNRHYQIQLTHTIKVVEGAKGERLFYVVPNMKETPQPTPLPLDAFIAKLSGKPELQAANDETAVKKAITLDPKNLKNESEKQILMKIIQEQEQKYRSVPSSGKPFVTHYSQKNGIQTFPVTVTEGGVKVSYDVQLTNSIFIGQSRTKADEQSHALSRYFVLSNTGEGQKGKFAEGAMGGISGIEGVIIPAQGSIQYKELKDEKSMVLKKQKSDDARKEQSMIADSDVLRGKPAAIYESKDSDKIRKKSAERGAFPMRRAQGMELYDYLYSTDEGKKLKPEERVQLAKAVVDAVDQQVHAKNKLHLDIKPENLMVKQTKEGFKVTVIDFGLGEQLGLSSQLITDRTVGTPGYMDPNFYNQIFSPSRVGHYQVNKSTDVYSVGTVIAEITGHLDSDTFNEDRVQQINFNKTQPSRPSKFAAPVFNHNLGLYNESVDCSIKSLVEAATTTLGPRPTLKEMSDKLGKIHEKILTSPKVIDRGPHAELNDAAKGNPKHFSEKRQFAIETVKKYIESKGAKLQEIEPLDGGPKRFKAVIIEKVHSKITEAKIKSAIELYNELINPQVKDSAAQQFVSLESKKNTEKLETSSPKFKFINDNTYATALQSINRKFLEPTAAPEPSPPPSPTLRT